MILWMAERIHAHAQQLVRRISDEPAHGRVDLHELSGEIDQSHGNGGLLECVPQPRFTVSISPLQHDPRTGLQPQLQLPEIDGLGHAVVRTFFPGLYPGFSLVPLGHEDHVDVLPQLKRAYGVANVRPRQLRHGPIKNREPRRIVSLQQLQRLHSVFGNNDVVTSFP